MGLVNPSNTGYQHIIAGNTIDDGEKWGITIHGSHFGLIDNNIVFDTTGSAIMAEGGNERGNVFSNNFVIKVGIQLLSWENPTYGGVRGAGRPLEWDDFGYEGSGLWFVGNDHIVTGNVVANAKYAGYMFNARRFGFISNHGRYPNHRGADMDDASQWTPYGETGDPAPPIIAMDNNEAYALSEFIWVSFAGVVTNESSPISNSTGWNIKQRGLYSQRNSIAHYKNLTILGDLEATQLSDRRRRNVGVYMLGTYTAGRNVFEGLKVHNMDLGISLPARIKGRNNLHRLTSFDDVELKNYVNIIDNSTRESEKETQFNNLRSELNPGPSNKVFSNIPAHIFTKIAGPSNSANITWLSTFNITGWQGIVGDDFEIFFDEQAPNFVMETRVNHNGVILHEQNCPTLDNTNAECQALHGISTLDRVATCDPTVEPQIEDIHAIVCPVEEFPDLIFLNGFE